MASVTARILVRPTISAVPEHPSESPAPRVPGPVLAAWRAGLLLAMTAYATIAAQVVRGLMGGFGLGLRDCVTVGAASLVTMLAVLPLGAVFELPEALWCHWLPERRWRSGDCPACGYGAARSRCPECGASFARPAAYASGWGTLRRAAWIMLPAWAVGLAAGLVLVQQDESRFVQQVSTLRASVPEAKDHARRRAWPADFAELAWNAGRGFSGPPPFESPKAPNRDWMPPR